MELHRNTGYTGHSEFSIHINILITGSGIVILPIPTWDVNMGVNTVMHVRISTYIRKDRKISPR
jgi:hypothetical protein